VPVSNDLPEPYYPSCATIKHTAKDATPNEVWKDLKNMVIVMEQLNAMKKDKVETAICNLK
jgi:hypothetical protein